MLLNGYAEVLLVYRLHRVYCMAIGPAVPHYVPW